MLDYNEASTLTVDLTIEDAETIVSYIKAHEKEDIPEDVWEVCMRLWDALYDGR